MTTILAVKKDAIHAAIEQCGEIPPQIGDSKLYSQFDFAGFILGKCESSYHVGERQDLEKDLSYLHPIPYNVVVAIPDPNENDPMATALAAVYRRTSMVGEQRLAGNYSIGFGGHVDYSGAPPAYAGHFLKAVEDASYRELEEEIGLSQDDIESIIPLTTILDYSNEVGQHHIGLANIVILRMDRTHALMDKVAKSIETGLEFVGWKAVSNLRTDLADVPMDSWSRMLIERLEIDDHI